MEQIQYSAKPYHKKLAREELRALVKPALEVGDTPEKANAGLQRILAEIKKLVPQ